MTAKISICFIFFMVISFLQAGDSVLLKNGTKVEGRIVRAVPAFVEIQKTSGVTLKMDVEDLHLSVKTNLPENVSSVYKKWVALSEDYKRAIATMEEMAISFSNANQKAMALAQLGVDAAEKDAKEARARANAAKRGIEVEISDVSMRIVDDMDQYVTVAWKVNLKNMTDRFVKGHLLLRFLDNGDFEVHEAASEEVGLQAGASTSVSDQMFMTKAKYGSITQTTGSFR